MTETIIILAGLIFWLRIEYATYRSGTNHMALKQLADLDDRIERRADLRYRIHQAGGLSGARRHGGEGNLEAKPEVSTDADESGKAGPTAL